MVYAEHEESLIWVVKLIGGSMSALCCFIVCMCYICYPSLRGYEFRLIFYLAFSDMIASGLYAIPPHDNYVACNFQGAFLNFANNLRLASCAVISRSIHLTHKGAQDTFRDKEKICSILILALCMLSAGLPFTTDNYGIVQGFCWIHINGDSYLTGTIWRLSTFYIPLWIIIIYVCYVYYRVIKEIKMLRVVTEIHNRHINNAIKRLALYPAILIIGWLPVSVQRCIEMFDPEYRNLVFACISLGFASAIGLFHALAYGITPEVKRALGIKCFEERRFFDSDYDIQGTNTNLYYS